MELTQGDPAASSPPAYDILETLQAQSRKDPLSQAGSTAEEPLSDLDPAQESPMELSQGDQASTSPPGHDTPETLQAQSQEDPLSKADSSAEEPPSSPTSKKKRISKGKKKRNKHFKHK